MTAKKDEFSSLPPSHREPLSCNREVAFQSLKANFKHEVHFTNPTGIHFIAELRLCLCAHTQFMPKAIHECLALNSCNRKVAIHCALQALRNSCKKERFGKSPPRFFYLFSISIIISTLVACLPPSNSFARKASRISMARQEPITLAPMQSTFASLCCLVILAE